MMLWTTFWSLPSDACYPYKFPLDSAEHQFYPAMLPNPDEYLSPVRSNIISPTVLDSNPQGLLEDQQPQVGSNLHPMPAGSNWKMRPLSRCQRFIIVVLSWGSGVMWSPDNISKQQWGRAPRWVWTSMGKDNEQFSWETTNHKQPASAMTCSTGTAILFCT